MADSAFQVQYRTEYIQAFEQHKSLLLDTVTTEHVVKGNQAIFLVAGSGGAEATTRGLNGLIPARSDSNIQTTVTLLEWNDLVRKTGFNIFASQGNQTAMMQMTSVAVLNRKIDDIIIDALNTGTVTVGAAGTIPNVSLFQNMVVKLQNASVPWDSNLTLLVQPSFLAYLEQTPEFANAMYVDMRPYAGDSASWRDKPMAYKWRNTLIIAHPNLPGKGTTSEKSFLYHKAAIGFAIDTGGLMTDADFDREQNYSWARATAYMGGMVIQNSGIVVATTDGTAYS